MPFPIERPRRLRRTSALRDLVAQTDLTVHDLICPLFICPGHAVRREVPSMPGVFQLSADEAAEEALRLRDLGLRAVLLFGLPEFKDPVGSGASAEDGIVPRAVRALRQRVRDLILVTDVCLCEYTSHGHCGLVEEDRILNDPTLERLAAQAVSHAQAGADVVAPSDMMDGRVGAIRDALDRAGHSDTPILSYAAKYASAFYGPFRDAAQSSPQFGDRTSYQMDPRNAREALREVRLDLEEGADIVMVKPALPYLDIIRRVHEATDRPVAAYQVSGEYACILAAARNGWVDGDRAMLEALTSIRRAGADLIVTYFAPQAARLLRRLGHD